MTAAEIAIPTAEYARTLTDKIKVAVEGTWHLITEAYQSRAWSALGYSSWDDYCTREFGQCRLRLPREDRAETVQSLRSSGLSLRAIESATGHSQHTIIRDLREEKVLQSAAPDDPALVDHATGEVLDDGVDVSWADKIDAEVEASGSPYIAPVPTVPSVDVEPEPEPAKVTGIDGKRYAQTSTRKPPRKPLIDVAKTRGFGLRSATESLMKVFEDDRYHSNEKQVADVLRGHLLYVAETVAAVLDQLP